MIVGPMKPAGGVPEVFGLSLSLQIQDFQTEWKRCSMLANYLAEYVSYQFAQRERAENLISIITNELLEALVCLAPGGSAVGLSLKQLEDGILLELVHKVKPESLTSYFSFLSGLQNGHNDSTYLALLTSEKKSADYFNQLGLAMLAHDFSVSLAARQDEPTQTICTQVFVEGQEFQNQPVS